MSAYLHRLAENVAFVFRNIKDEAIDTEISEERNYRIDKVGVVKKHKLDDHIRPRGVAEIACGRAVGLLYNKRYCIVRGKRKIYFIFTPYELMDSASRHRDDLILISIEVISHINEGEIGLKSNITFYTEELYNYYLEHKEVSVGYRSIRRFVPNPEEVGYDIILEEIKEVNHLAITRAGRGGSSVAVIDSIIGGMKPMRTGFFAFITSKKQKAVKDSAPSFGKTVLEAVKNSKGKTEEELAGEMKGVLDSMSVLKDCEAKNKLVDVVKDCFDNKEMTVANEAEVTATLDSMWIDIHGDSLKEMAKAFAKLAEPAEKPAVDAGTKDSKDSEEEKDSKEEKDEKDSKEEKDEKDSKEEKEEKEEGEKDSKEEKDSKDEKDGCHGTKDSAPLTKDDVLSAVKDSLKAELKPMVAEAVKECLGLKDGAKTPVEGFALDSADTSDDVAFRDYSSFLE